MSAGGEQKQIISAVTNVTCHIIVFHFAQLHCWEGGEEPSMIGKMGDFLISVGVVIELIVGMQCSIGHQQIDFLKINLQK